MDMSSDLDNIFDTSTTNIMESFEKVQGIPICLD